MMDKLKSVLLAVLVAASLFQTYLLAFRGPDFAPVSQSEYVEAEWIGQQEEADGLLFPYEMVLHLGGNEHTVLYPEFNFYNIIFDKIRQRTFSGIRAVSGTMIDEGELRAKRKGVEIRFKQEIPMELLRSVMPIRDSSTELPNTINRIWLTMSESQEEVRTYFFGGAGEPVYEVTHADLTIRDLEEFVGFGQFLPRYKPMRLGSYYVPIEPVEYLQMNIAFGAYTPEQLQKSLFVNPAVSRNLLERDGTEIYTDGKRGLQIYQNTYWMSYSDPVAPVEASADLRENLLSAVKFVNRHGGWNGNYLFSEHAGGATQTFTFRQYVQPFMTGTSLPIVSIGEQKFGYIQVVLQEGTVTNYERSMLYVTDKVSEVRSIQMPVGDVLERMLQNHDLRSRIQSIFPAYMPILRDEYVELRPRWVIQLDDGSYEYLE